MSCPGERLPPTRPTGREDGPDLTGMTAPLPSLAGAAFLRGPGLVRVFEAIAAGHGAARVVGGAVRNSLIGRAVGDIDVATDLMPDAVIAAAEAAGLKPVPTGIEHGTVTVVVDGEPVEVTTLRRDVETDGRRAVVAFTRDWATDAGRRDFTMNAIYASADGTLFDPTDGYADLLRRHVRFIGDAEMRIREDYLRILRFFRFHAEIGRGAPDGAALVAITRLAPGLEAISRERIRQELLRLLMAPGAGDAVAAMAASGVLAALGLRATAIEQLARLIAIETALGRAGDALLRLAALALADGEGAAELAERFRLSNAEEKRLAAIYAGAHGISPGLSKGDLQRQCYRLGQPALRDCLLLAWTASAAPVDAGAWRASWDAIQTLDRPEFPIRGRDLVAAGLTAGPTLGKTLARLEADWIAGGFTASKAELIRMAADGPSPLSDPAVDPEVPSS